MSQSCLLCWEFFPRILEETWSTSGLLVSAPAARRSRPKSLRNNSELSLHAPLPLFLHRLPADLPPVLQKVEEDPKGECFPKRSHRRRPLTRSSRHHYDIRKTRVQGKSPPWDSTELWVCACLHERCRASIQLKAKLKFAERASHRARAAGPCSTPARTTLRPQ
jgi:hypothetical protein